jgi:prepilin-type N-terminal cleavage/methylation domain-containing protein
MARSPDLRRTLGNDQGFTLIEILIASAIFAMVLVGIYVIYDANQATYTRGEGRANLQQNVRVALDEMTRELLMAGYDPTNILSNPAAYNTAGKPPGGIGNFPMETLGASSVRFLGDVNGDGVTEVVQFSYDSTNKRINRQIWTWNGSDWATTGAQAITEDNIITSLTFTYCDETNAVTANDYAVRRIEISFLGTVKVGSQGTQTLSLNSDVRPRNLSLE